MAEKQSSYAAAGVDVGGEAAALAGLIGHVKETHLLRPAGTPGHVRSGVGYFAAVVELTRDFGLAVAADGVGTKLLVAQLADRYDTVGIDLVAMNVNDLVCIGAEPITFLDYVAVEGLDAEMLTAIGQGLKDGCIQAGCTISGGELAQIGAMLKGAKPGKAFDLAGVAIGIIPLDQVNLGQAVQPGDVVVGLASSGIHSNGLSLARRVLLEQAGLGLDDPLPHGAGVTVGEALLTPTRIYVKPALATLRDPDVEVSALAHITGGGFGNMGRIAAPCGYRLDNLPEPPPIFKAIQEAGDLPLTDLYPAYNMGVGFTITVRPGGEAKVIEHAAAHGIAAQVIGQAIDAPDRRIELPGIGMRIDESGFHTV